MLPILRSVAALREQVAQWREAGLRVAFVPTMGALHDGHLSLVKAGLAEADRVLVSIFVNPTQFGPNEDFAAYPRTEEADVAKLAQAGAQAVYAPSVEEMYPQGASTTVHVAGVSEGLCGTFRPGHFDGVATVVSKLLNQAQPDVALFGEKDFQQLQVIRRLARDLDLPVAIRGVATLREADGLAMSSRNAYLSPAERAIAPALYRTLSEAAAHLQGGADAEPVLKGGIEAILEAGFGSVDYLELRSAEDLAPLARLDRPARLIVAARLGRARLIDNIPVNLA
ncbi:MAG TPA: pantoate--beta-alanine ligase [Magnetospirillaceae bacterium]|nr:pantoate--beta-alanine ligase [Magnetospirillaceae bacterium]